MRGIAYLRCAVPTEPQAGPVDDELARSPGDDGKGNDTTSADAQGHGGAHAAHVPARHQAAQHPLPDTKGHADHRRDPAELDLPARRGGGEAALAAEGAVRRAW